MKLRNKFFVLVLAIVTLFSVTGCATIKDGNKITKGVMTLEFYKADGTVGSTSEVSFELYENNSPKTVAHVKRLINDKYYDGVCVSNVANHFIELGEYYYDADGNFTKKAYDTQKYGKVKGEFYNNGTTGQKLSSGTQAIIMKHDRVQKTADANKFDTATSGLMFMTSGLVDLDKNNYCVIGKVISDDGDAALTDTSISLDEIDRSPLSSFGIINSIHDIDIKVKDDVSTITYYQESTGKWFELVRQNGQTTVYETTDGTRQALTEAEQDLFINNVQNTISTGGFKDEYYDYFTIPYQKIIVKSIRLK